MLLFMGEVTVHTTSYPHFPCPGCCFFFNFFILIFLFVYFFNIVVAYTGPFAALHAMLKTHYPANIILDIIEKGVGRVSSLFFCLAVVR